RERTLFLCLQPCCPMSSLLPLVCCTELCMQRVCTELCMQQVCTELCMHWVCTEHCMHWVCTELCMQQVWAGKANPVEHSCFPQPTLEV
uniref:Uncharacterized protein n=1 Tax=Phasianus colchicus TaxID=9054 RepID=A0A669QAL4_PHACC